MGRKYFDPGGSGQPGPGHFGADQSRPREPLTRQALPEDIYAHLLLVDIDSPAEQARGLPRYIRLEAKATIIGRAVGARILLDDPRTVQVKHALILFGEGIHGAEFSALPLSGSSVRLNGLEVPAEGAACQSGDVLEIGSARLIFFMKDMAAQSGTSGGSRGF